MDYASTLDPLDAALSRELRRDERLLWSGKPIRRIDQGKFAIWLFAIPWTAFALFWTAGASIPFFAIDGDENWSWIALLFPLFGLPFIAVGIGMLSVPFLPLFLSHKTKFAVTDQRLIKLSLGRRLKSETVPADRIGLIERSENADGSGTLKIATKIGRDSDGDRSVETFDIGEVADILLVETKIETLSRRAASRAESALALNP